MGIEDEIGEEGKILPQETDKNKYGEDVRAELVGSRETGAYAKFVPVIDDYLKEHLFADISEKISIYTAILRETEKSIIMRQFHGLKK